jgi:hypothetical protein
MSDTVLPVFLPYETYTKQKKNVSSYSTNFSNEKMQLRMTYFTFSHSAESL